MSKGMCVLRKLCIKWLVQIVVLSLRLSQILNLMIMRVMSAVVLSTLTIVMIVPVVRATSVIAAVLVGQHIPVLRNTDSSQSLILHYTVMLIYISILDSYILVYQYALI